METKVSNERGFKRMNLIAMFSGIVLSILGASCDRDPNLACLCGAYFAGPYRVLVLDAAGSPVVGLSPTVTLVRTGQRIIPTEQPYDGRYPTISDDQRAMIRLGGDTVRFQVASAQGSGTANLVFDVTNGECRCHILKVAGPDTLVLQP